MDSQHDEPEIVVARVTAEEWETQRVLQRTANTLRERVVALERDLEDYRARGCLWWAQVNVRYGLRAAVVHRFDPDNGVIVVDTSNTPPITRVLFR